MTAPALFQQASVRPFEIVGDGMQPTLRSGDFLMVVPIDRYDQDGIYLIGAGDDAFPIRAQIKIGSGSVMLMRDNPAYDTTEIPLADFNASVTGKAIAEVKMRITRSQLLELAA